jgi:hypothetical protein
MTSGEVTKIKNRISIILQAHAGISPSTASSLLPSMLLPIRNLQGKLYEASVLASVCENLVTREGCRINFVGGNVIKLKQKGSPINRNFPFFEVHKGNKLLGELFTDTYFSTISYFLKGSPRNLGKGDYHELDIALVMPGINGYPGYREIITAIECKDTSIKKSIIRELLGFRRELSFYSQLLQPTHFTSWPASQLNASPGSVHMFYCTDVRVRQFEDNCAQFGIIIVHHRM